MAGSSPLTRGKHRPWRRSRRSGRLIPAHAGKTGHLHRREIVDAAHPRSRGENTPPQDEDDCYTGSSPLTRGKRGLGTPGRRHRRLIPAHAGKTCLRGSAVGPRPAHPRSRGENRDMGGTVPPRPGSSPLTRGKPPDGSRATANRRLIPAHAGKTRPGRPRRGWRGAHPRSRGENRRRGRELFRLAGSSPLTRGKRRTCQLFPFGCRLIPAHAGKTRMRPRSRAVRRAHPRSRGENGLLHGLDEEGAGSSPLTRGKPDQDPEPVGHVGLIPAHAGKTARAPVISSAQAAHPRSRGENTPRRSAPTRRHGSSPLTRGKPARWCPSSRRGRLIPAHAGKTKGR